MRVDSRVVLVVTRSLRVSCSAIMGSCTAVLLLPVLALVSTKDARGAEIKRLAFGTRRTRGAPREA